MLIFIMYYTDFFAKSITANLVAEKNNPNRAIFPRISKTTLVIPTNQLIL